MASPKRLTPKAGKLTNPEVPIEATNPAEADPTYETDTRCTSDQDGNKEHARRQVAASARRRSRELSRHVARAAKR